METWKLDVYRVVDGTDNWPLIETLTADSAQQAVACAEENYGYSSWYHWTNPYTGDRCQEK